MSIYLFRCKDTIYGRYLQIHLLFFGETPLRQKCRIRIVPSDKMSFLIGETELGMLVAHGLLQMIKN